MNGVCEHVWYVSILEDGEAKNTCTLCGTLRPENLPHQKVCSPRQNDANIGTSAENLEREIGELKNHVANVKKYRSRLKLLEKALKILRSL